MRTGKFQKITKKKRNNSTKIVTILLAMVLLLCCCIGGTVAWLMDTTDAVTNTFTIGDITLTLVESPYDAANNSYSNPEENVNNSYPLIPGNTYKKNPKVTVLANSEDCYLFVKMEKFNNPDTYLTFSFKNDYAETEKWTLVPGETDVYYRVVTKKPSDQSWDLLVANTDGYTITVKNTIVKNTPTADANAPKMPTAGNEPKLVFTAYAVQQANLSVAEAWAKVSSN